MRIRIEGGNLPIAVLNSALKEIVSYGYELRQEGDQLTLLPVKSKPAPNIPFGQEGPSATMGHIVPFRR